MLYRVMAAFQYCRFSNSNEDIKIYLMLYAGDAALYAFLPPRPSGNNSWTVLAAYVHIFASLFRLNVTVTMPLATETYNFTLKGSLLRKVCVHLSRFIVFRELEC